MDVRISAVGDCSVRRLRRGDRVSVSLKELLLVGVRMWCPCILGLGVRMCVGICTGTAQSVSCGDRVGVGVPRSDVPKYVDSSSK